MSGAKGIFGIFSGAALALFCLLAPAARAVDIPLPQTVNYVQYAASEINSQPFDTDVVKGRVAAAFDITQYYGPAPSCSLNGSTANVEAFIINKNWCVKEQDTLTYKVLLENKGDQTAYNLHINIDWPKEAAQLLNSTIPENYIGSSDSADKEFHESPDVPVFEFAGHTDREYSLTLLVLKVLKPFTVSLTGSYYDCRGRIDRYQCLQACIPNCMGMCETTKNQCKNTCTSTFTQCNDSWVAYGNNCGNLCKNNTDSAGCMTQCQQNAVAGSAQCASTQTSCNINCDTSYDNCKNSCYQGCEPECDRAHLVSTEHSIDGNCDQPPQFTTTPFAGEPAIICHPGDLSCVGDMPDLGPHFKDAESWDFWGLKPPDLGPRFREAVADILPGECSVIKDNIISSPAYQDALNRQARVADVWMQPLHDSGTDFSKLIIQNEVLNIKNKAYAKEKMREIHRKWWSKLGNKLDRVMQKEEKPNQVKEQEYVDGFLNEARDLQKELTKKYADIQEQKKQKFDAVAETAKNNAIQSICRACPDCGSDAGLQQLLVAVKELYVEYLEGRKLDYDEMQDVFTTTNPNENWRKDLREALDAFSAGNPKPLQKFIDKYIEFADAGMESDWQASYEQFYQQDKYIDNEFRINHWETALDTPKTVATMCAQKKLFGPKVEESWCESNGYPEFIIRGAPNPAKSDIQPPDLIKGGENANIDPLKVIGDVCGGEPGDPYWADDCSCHCDQIIPGSGPKMRFCGDDRPITQHDINITSQEECLKNLPRHLNPYF